MPMSAQRPPGKLLGKTLEVVLSRRPCRVVIDSQVAQPFESVALGKERRPQSLDNGARVPQGRDLGEEDSARLTQG